MKFLFQTFVITYNESIHYATFWKSSHNDDAIIAWGNDAIIRNDGHDVLAQPKLSVIVWPAQWGATALISVYNKIVITYRFCVITLLKQRLLVQ